MLPTGPEYFYTYFGILLAGGIPVPIYPPARLSQIEEHVRRHAGILSNAEATILVTVPEARGVARLLEARVAGLRRVVTVAELQEGGRAPLPVPIRPDDIAFIQYTSGSTGDPKGVVLTHANLLANIRAIGEAIDVRPDDVLVSWLPLYHDMGLIGVWLASLYFAMPLVVMSPLAFLARPERWLRAIQRYRGTISAAPNFAYELCVKRIDDAEIDGLDLSSWRIAVNGAEPVIPETLRRFTERFARYGFQPAAMTPVYGLAECTVGLLFPPLDRGPRVDRVRASPSVSLDAPSPRRPTMPARCASSPAAARCPGTRCASSTPSAGRWASASRGDWSSGGPRRPAATTAIRSRRGACSTATGSTPATAPTSPTARCYLTGRVKDIIIRGGRNIYPHELEDAVGAVPGVRQGCVAVFGSPDPSTGTERLVVLAETRETGRGSAGGAARTDRRGHRRGARRTARRGGAGAAAHGAQDLERKDPPRRVPRTLRSGTGRCARARRLVAGHPPDLRIAAAASAASGREPSSTSCTASTGG